jgi:hypothetical protein
MSDAISSSDWTASHDHMPGKPRVLRVDGTILYPSSDYLAFLEPSEPQGIYPRIREMNVREQPPTGIVLPALTPVRVHYEDETESEYDQVHIREVVQLVDVVHPNSSSTQRGRRTRH